LEKKRERIFNKFKEQERLEKIKENNNLTIPFEHSKSQDYESEYDHPVKSTWIQSKIKKKDDYRRSLRIMAIAGKLEQHMHGNKPEYVDIGNKENDEYTKIILDKPIKNKSNKKIKRANFVLKEQDNF
jgi:hypothetical protein